MSDGMAGRISDRFGRYPQSYDLVADLQRRVARHLARRISVYGVKRVLEVGCGTGILARARRQQPPCSVFSDFSLPMLRRARELHKKNDSNGNAARNMDDQNVFWVAADAARPCWKNNSFDGICASMVVHWFDQPGDVLSRLVSGLRPGGILAVSFPAVGSLDRWHDMCRDYGLGSGPIDFPDPRAIAAALTSCVVVEEDETIYGADYDRCRDFVMEMRDLGALASRAGHRPNPARLRRLLRDSRALRVRWRIVTMIARRGVAAS